MTNDTISVAMIIVCSASCAFSYNSPFQLPRDMLPKTHVEHVTSS